MRSVSNRTTVIHTTAADSVHLRNVPPCAAGRRQVPCHTAMLLVLGMVVLSSGRSGRTAMRLAAACMQLDSVETALRQNAACAVHTFADAREHGAAPGATFDFDRRAAPRSTRDPLARLRVVEIAPGNRIRAVEGEPLSAACVRWGAEEAGR